MWYVRAERVLPITDSKIDQATMLLAYKDKEGSIHVDAVSESEGERINREVSSMGFATPPQPQEEDQRNQLPALDHPNSGLSAQWEEPGDNEGTNSESADDASIFSPEEWAEIEGKVKNTSTALNILDELDLDALRALTIINELLIQVVAAFENVSYSPESLSFELGGYPHSNPNLTLSKAQFQDILKNFVHGKGSILDLLQLRLADSFQEYLLLFRDGQIGIESLKAEISGNDALTDFDLWNLNFEDVDQVEDVDQARQRFESGYDSATFGRKWVPNIMLKKALPFWRADKFDPHQIDDNIAVLDEQTLRQSLLTDEFLQSIPGVPMT